MFANFKELLSKKISSIQNMMNYIWFFINYGWIVR